MNGSDFRSRRTTDPPQGYAPVWPAPLVRPTTDGWWRRLWRRFLGRRPGPATTRLRLTGQSARYGRCHQAARILAECADRDQGEEP